MSHTSTIASDSLIATGLIDINSLEDDIKPVVWKGKQVDSDKLKHLSFQNLLGLDGEEDTVPVDPITGHLNLTLPRNSPSAKPKIKNIKDLFFEDVGKKPKSNQNATPLKSSKPTPSVTESTKLPTSSNPVTQPTNDEASGRHRAHTISETRTKSGTFSSDQQLKLEELRRKLLSDVTQAKTPSDTKKQSQAARSESGGTKRVTINAPDDPKTHSKQDSGDPFSKYLQPQHSDDVDSPKISPFNDDHGISEAKSPLSEKDRRPATSLGIQREKVSKEKAPTTPSSEPVQPSPAPQDENPKVLLRHASMSLIPNLKEGDEKQMKVEMILKNIKQQRQKEEKIQQILQSVNQKEDKN